MAHEQIILTDEISCSMWKNHDNQSGTYCIGEIFYRRLLQALLYISVTLYQQVMYWFQYVFIDANAT